MPATRTTSEARLENVRDMIQACIQCGTCTASCPNQFAMDMPPRRLWRLVLMNRIQTIFSSKTFILCSSCYYCTLRCPRGLPLTEAMAKLKQIAARETPRQNRTSTVFYRDFMDNVRRHGRVKEMELMTRYFTHMKNPLLPLEAAPLGLKLISKGKLALQLPKQGNGKLKALFEKVAEMEKIP